MWEQIIGSIWFGLPGGFANIAPILAAKLIPSWNYPLDGYQQMRGRRILGDHKTVRGLVAGVIIGTLTFVWQQYITIHSPSLSEIAWIRYETLPGYLGAFFGFGAIIGDSVKSLVKRQFNIAPGNPWFPFDQADWIVGMLVCISPWIGMTMQQTIVIFAVGIALHLVSKIIGKLLRLNRTFI